MGFFVKTRLGNIFVAPIEHLVCGLFEGHIGMLLPKKFPSIKNALDIEKRAICDYLLLNCIKKCDISYSTITKTTSIIRKSAIRLHTRLFNCVYSANGFRVIFVLYVNIGPSFYMQFFVFVLMMLVVFVIVEYNHSHYFTVIQFNSR